MHGNAFAVPLASANRQANMPQAGGGGGGDTLVADVAGLKQNVGFLNWAAGLLFVAGVSGFLILQGQLDAKITPINDKLTEIRVQNAAQAEKLSQVLQRLEQQDVNAQRGAGAKQAQ